MAVGYDCVLLSALYSSHRDRHSAPRLGRNGQQQAYFHLFPDFCSILRVTPFTIEGLRKHISAAYD